MQEHGELRLSLIVATTGSHGRLWCACFSSKVEGGPFLSYVRTFSTFTFTFLRMRNNIKINRCGKRRQRADTQSRESSREEDKKPQEKPAFPLTSAYKSLRRPP